MSKVYFHSPESVAEIRGSERAYMREYISSLFVSTLDIPYFFEKESPFFKLLPPGYLKDEVQYVDKSTWSALIDSLKIWLRSLASDSYLLVDDLKLDIFGAQLNTALLAGSDPIKLMARLHGQCEIHCYVEAKNREWLAKIIEKGLKTAIYRQDQGWESVIALLRNGAESPVVTSYSVCDGFPGPCKDSEEVLRWESKLQELRDEPRRSLELDPETWDDFYFLQEWDAFRLNHLLSIPRSEWAGVVKNQ